jgi:hypothetical protein
MRCFARTVIVGGAHLDEVRRTWLVRQVSLTLCLVLKEEVFNKLVLLWAVAVKRPNTVSLGTICARSSRSNAASAGQIGSRYSILLLVFADFGVPRRFCVHARGEGASTHMLTPATGNRLLGDHSENGIRFTL